MTQRRQPICDNIERALAEASRFEAAARRALKALEKPYCCGSRDVAACRRASMDLARALADVRRPYGYRRT